MSSPIIELRIANSELQNLRDSMLRDKQENCAVLLAGIGYRSDGSALILVRESVFPGPEDYTQRAIDRAELEPAFVARVAKKARLSNLSLVFVHSHPGTSIPQFSQVDDDGEEKLATFLANRGQSAPHFALVISEGGISARVLGLYEPISVVSVGNERNAESSPEAANTETFPMFKPSGEGIW